MFQPPNTDLLRLARAAEAGDPAAPHRWELLRLQRRAARDARARRRAALAAWLRRRLGGAPSHPPEPPAPPVPPPVALQALRPAAEAPRGAAGTPDGPRRAA